MKNITEQQFKNFRKQIYRRFDHVFLRLDQQDDMIGLLYKKVDVINENLDRRNENMERQIKELKDMNSKMDLRVASLETWRSSYTS
ncbi:MAG: hypothetical protein WDO14_04540 [Bacteroidota bacterium]